MNGTWLALALFTIGGLLVWAGLTGGSLFAALSFGAPAKPAGTR